MLFNRLKNEGEAVTTLSIDPHVISELVIRIDNNDILSRFARISEVPGRFPGALCQHLFVNFQMAGVNPSASACTG